MAQSKDAKVLTIYGEGEIAKKVTFSVRDQIRLEPVKNVVEHILKVAQHCGPMSYYEYDENGNSKQITMSVEKELEMLNNLLTKIIGTKNENEDDLFA